MARFKRVKFLSAWRKLSLAFWRTANDPTVYGWYDVDVTNILEFLNKANKDSSVKVTLTHYFAKALALTIAQNPMMNGIIKRGSIYLRDSVDIFLQVAIPSSGKDRQQGDHLSGAKICQADQKLMTEIAAELCTKAGSIRQQKDPQFQKQFSLAKFLPAWLLRKLVQFNGFLVYELGISLPTLGIFADPFGSAMITNVGPLDCPPGFAPLVPPSRCPLIICIGRVEKKPWVMPDDKIEARPIVTFTCTFDHRFIDGLTASKMFKTFMEILYHPEIYQNF